MSSKNPFTKHSCSQSILLEVYLTKNYEFTTNVKDISKDYECPICLTVKGECCSCSTYWCRTSCHHDFHIGCLMNAIFSTLPTLKCPICQTEWKKKNSQSQ